MIDLSGRVRGSGSVRARPAATMRWVRTTVICASAALFCHYVDAKSSGADLPADLWKHHDPAMAHARRLLKGEPNAVLASLVNNPELEKAWSDPQVFGKLLATWPFLSAIRGIGDIAASGRALTAEDGLKALGLLRNFATSSMSSLESISTPYGFAQKFKQYADDEDIRVLAGKGDRQSNVALQQAIIDKEIGPIIDLTKMGWDGTEPENLKVLRSIAMEDESLWSLFHQDDPVIRKVLEQPTFAAKSSADMLSFLAEEESNA